MKVFCMTENTLNGRKLFVRLKVLVFGNCSICWMDETMNGFLFMFLDVKKTFDNSVE